MAGLSAFRAVLTTRRLIFRRLSHHSQSVFVKVPPDRAADGFVARRIAIAKLLEF
jgi:hypothetical protein